MELTRDQINSVSPDRYTLPSRMDFSAKITIKGRHPIPGEDKSDIPGPGAYNVPGVGSSSRCIKFKGRTQTAPISQTPGPGAYNIGVSKNSAMAITMKSRSPVKVKNDTPAPNAYTLTSTNGARDIMLKSRPREILKPPPTEFCYTPQKQRSDYGQIVFKSRHVVDDASTRYTPAPGDYKNVSPQFYRTPVTLKSRHEPKIDANAVGPGQYSPNYRFTNPNHPSDIKMKGGHQQQKVQSTDAFYNLPSCFGSAKNIRLKGRVNTAPTNISPGPGAYSPNYRSDLGKEIKFGTRTTRPGTLDYELRSNENPGPIYNIPGAASAARDIRIKVRKPEKLVSDTPGPGAYDVDEPFKMTQVPVHDVKILARSSPPRQQLDNVGPGSYNIENGSYVRSQKRGITMGMRTKGYVIGRIK